MDATDRKRTGQPWSFRCRMRNASEQSRCDRITACVNAFDCLGCSLEKCKGRFQKYAAGERKD